MQDTVLITGCSSGLGRTAARHFASKGWNVVATMRRPDLEIELTTISNVLVARLDVEDEESIHSAITSGIRSFGAIHAIVNNAGFGLDGIFEATPAEKIRAQFDVNLFGVMNTTRAILPHFRARKSGVVVNISSGSGVFALPGTSLYCASKFALEGFSEALLYELASQGVKIKLVEPGGIFSTEFFRRSAREASVNVRLADYDDFMLRTEKFFEYVQSHFGGTEEEVCECIYGAVTDGTDQLRYVATKDIEALVHARRATSEVEYMAVMRENFERWTACS